MNHVRNQLASATRRLARVVAVSLPPVALCAAAAASAWPLRPYYDFVHFVSIGRFDSALESFADDATVIVDGSCPADDPCVGKAAIAARYLAALRNRDLPLPLVDQRFDGRWLLTRGDAAFVATRRDGVRRHGSHRVELRDGRIRWLEFRWNQDQQAR